MTDPTDRATLPGQFFSIDPILGFCLGRFSPHKMARFFLPDFALKFTPKCAKLAHSNGWVLGKEHLVEKWHKPTQIKALHGFFGGKDR